MEGDFVFRLSGDDSPPVSTLNSPQKLDKATFTELKNTSPVVFIFISEHCGACIRDKALLKRFAKEAKKHVEVAFVRSTDGEFHELRDIYDIKTVPSIVAIDGRSR